ncbi:hypothetical protein [Sagittula stellata]|uniref:Arginyl-tRNA-protein transferase n=1 Tax=Sagittula stellata (strain ATCC 700073 / DSM 11524 / E-37) TaxID=388399 RepID=A3K2B5_SAGS3|nr:hypothetical protein [Sagittula stellata]EBA09061.1 arginyl-tRNA-protein transferase [Sagittula stellata E-37]
MYASRIAGPARRTVLTPQAPRHGKGPVRAGDLTGPVHRRGTARHDSHLMDMDDPAAWLMAPSTGFNAAARLAARGVILLAVGILMAPAIPVLLG